MAYIIENVNLLRESSIEKTSILIKDNRIDSIYHSFEKISYMRMNAKSFMMAPTYILYAPHLPLDGPYHRLKQFYIDELIKKGCTVFLTSFYVERERLFMKKLKEIKMKLINCPIDYVLGVTIPICVLTPSFIRKCKKEKIPVIFVQIQDVKELQTIPWGWIKEAMFPYQPLLIPLWKEDNKEAKEAWIKTLRNMNIPHLNENLQKDTPIPTNVLRQIGIIPFKSHFHPGAEVSYNLYFMEDVNKMIEQSELFFYHENQLKVTVHKGTIIRCGEEVHFRPGFGEHVIIKTPSFFST